MYDIERLKRSHKELCEKIFLNRYAVLDREFTWDDTCKRLEAGIGYDIEPIYAKRFLPAGRIIANLGVKRLLGEDTDEVLFNCYVLEVSDNIEDIADKLSLAIKIFQKGGGIGFKFNLRPKGFELKRSRGKSSGLLSFIELYGKAIGTIIQGGGRRGAGLALVPIWHPDIRDFISAKKDLQSLKMGWSNFNISVGITKEFIDAVKQGTKFDLTWNGAVIDRVEARELLRDIAYANWECGDPGIFNLYNAQKEDKDVIAPNPCGETCLPAWGICNLGSIVLPKYVSKNKVISWRNMERDIRFAIRFLDNVIDKSEYIVEPMEAVAKRDRRIGLGVTGFGTFLNLLGKDYGSDDSYFLARELFEFIYRIADDESWKLAKEKGKDKRNNLKLLSVAPTGTLTFIASWDFDGMLSTSIEPQFDWYYNKYITIDGEMRQRLITSLEFIKHLKGINGDKRYLKKDLFDVAKEIQRPKASDLTWRRHIYMQEAIQGFVDMSVSKTVNVPNGFTKDETYELFEYAVTSKHIKGMTYWRDGCRTGNLCKIQSKEECATCG